ncbi:MAG: uroporphyrinogen-III C-methyltransferase, partial [Polynucleobacter victoriensis]
EAKLATVMAHEADLEAVIKGNLEAEKVIAPVAAKMTAVLNQINQLPMTALPATQAVTPSASPKAPSLTDKVFSAIQRMGDQLVRVQVVGDIKDLALTPAAQDLVRQQLRLTILSARMAWLSNMPQLAKEDLTQAQQLLTKHFQAQSTAVVNVQKMLVDIQADIAKPVVAKKGP